MEKYNNINMSMLVIFEFQFIRYNLLKRKIGLWEEALENESFNGLKMFVIYEEDS